MSEHELWNELGNLYFMTGTYSQAAYAYNRSIQMDSGFGRPYCNLALTYVKQGRYTEAVQLYQRSIDLLVDDNEKAITWYRLGDVYRHLKDYRDAIMAYQQADLLGPMLSQESRESDQILYGGSGSSTENAMSPKPEVLAPHKEIIQVAVPAPEEEKVEPSAVVAQEIQPVLDTAKSQTEEAVPDIPEVKISDSTVDAPIDNAISTSQNEEPPMAEVIYELPVDEPGVVADSVESQISSDPPSSGTAELSLDEPDNVGTLVLETQTAEPAPLAYTGELEQALPVEEIAISVQEAQAEVSSIMSPEAVVEESIPVTQERENAAGLNGSANQVDVAPGLERAEEVEIAPSPESQPAPLAEDPSLEFVTIADATTVREELIPMQEMTSDIADAGWVEDEHPYLDFEHETEVFIPEPEEEPLDNWLPITQSATVAVEPADRASKVMIPDQEPVIDEARYTGRTHPEYHPSPVPHARYAAEMSPAVEQGVDVEIQDDYAEAMFIIPEEQAVDARSEPNEIPSIEASSVEEEDRELKEIEREIVRFKQVVQANPRNASGWDTLGTLYKSARKYRDAILAYQQAVVADPSKAPYHHHLGIIYAVEGRDEDAIKAFQDVIEIDPSHSLAHASLGGYYRRMGLEELAQKHIGKAMKNFYNSENEYNRACLEALCGNTEQSIELLRVALKNKQTYVDWVLRDPDLDSIRRDPRFKQLISDYTA